VIIAAAVLLTKILTVFFNYVIFFS